MTAFMDGRSQIKVHTDERAEVHGARSFLVVTHPSTNRGRHALTSLRSKNGCNAARVGTL